MHAPHPDRPNATASVSNKLLSSLERFFQIEASSGIVLLAATAAALLWANSPWRASYDSLWRLTLTLPLGAHDWAISLRFLVNDALMTLFFLLVGLELRREIHEGALSSARAAVTPLVAALGGMIAPALIFLALTGTAELRRGWAIPTATDIAFASGALTLIGRLVPAQVRVLLLALAVADDIGAILVIAFFYSSGIASIGVLIATGGIGVIVACQRLGLQSAFCYVLPGLVVWIGIHQAGVHPTLAGVILGLLTPARASPARDARTDASLPVDRLQIALHPWVAYGIMPLFALANAGVAIKGLTYSVHSTRVLIVAIVLALAVGKPVGISLCTWLGSRSGLGALAPGLDWRGVLLVGCLGGVGFTMSLFLATLAFDDPARLTAAKLAVLLGSAISGLTALVLGRAVLFRKRAEINAV